MIKLYVTGFILTFIFCIVVMCLAGVPFRQGMQAAFWFSLLWPVSIAILIPTIIKK